MIEYQVLVIRTLSIPSLYSVLEAKWNESMSCVSALLSEKKKFFETFRWNSSDELHGFPSYFWYALVVRVLKSGIGLGISGVK